MILKTLQVDVEELAQRTGWVIKPEGACKDDRCVPLPTGAIHVAPTGSDGKVLDVRLLADRLGMHCCTIKSMISGPLGPEAGGHVLGSAVAPEIVLQISTADLCSKFANGQKVLLVAWASW